MKNTLSLRCAAAVAAITMTSIGLAPTAFAADPPATTSPVGAISGSWGSGCETITVNSGGWAAGDQVHVRWYGSATKATPGIDGETYVPAGQPWSQTVDPTKVRGFSFRIVDAAGNYRTPLKEQAASCIVVTGPAITAVRDDCDTVHVAVTNSSRRMYQGFAEIRDETGAVVQRIFTEQTGVDAGGVALYTTEFDAHVDLPTGHTYTMSVGSTSDGKDLYVYKSVQPVIVDLNESCPMPTPTETPTTPPVTPEPTVEPTTPAPTTPAPTTTAPTTPVPTTTAPSTTAPTTAPTEPSTPAPVVTAPSTTAPTTRPVPPVVTRPGTGVVTPMVTRTFQVDRYRPRTSAQARVVARLDDDRRLGFREDRALWGASAWQIVTVKVPANANNAQIVKAVNAKTSARIGDVSTTTRLGSAKAGRSYTMAWELGRGATPAKAWGARNATKQVFLARG